MTEAEMTLEEEAEETLGVEGRPLPAPGDESGGESVRPNVVVSQCLGFAAVRYNGQILKSRFVEALRDHVNFIQVCPEVGIGLGVPRDPIHIEEHALDDPDDEGREDVSEGDVGRRPRILRLIQPDTGRDVTDEMHAFSDRFLGGMQPADPTRAPAGGSATGSTASSTAVADGFILKTKSPSCGLTDTKIYGDGAESGPHRRGSGLFGGAVMEALPWAAIQDEGRLTNLRLRHHFLTHLWALARLRSVEASGRMERLVKFHASYKFILMMFGPEVPSRLGRIVANPDRRPVTELVAEYRRELGGAFRDPPEAGNTVNALQHVFGYVSEHLDAEERTYFLELLEEFREGRLPLPGILAVLRSWVVRFDEEYLADQHFFRPYPRVLFDLHSSGEGRVV